MKVWDSIWKMMFVVVAILVVAGSYILFTPDTGTRIRKLEEQIEIGQDCDNFAQKMRALASELKDDGVIYYDKAVKRAGITDIPPATREIGYELQIYSEAQTPLRVWCNRENEIVGAIGL